jgi:hypothetical protein
MENSGKFKKKNMGIGCPVEVKLRGLSSKHIKLLNMEAVTARHRLHMH